MRFGRRGCARSCHTCTRSVFSRHRASPSSAIRTPPPSASRRLPHARTQSGHSSQSPPFRSRRSIRFPRRRPPSISSTRAVSRHRDAVRGRCMAASTMPDVAGARALPGLTADDDQRIGECSHVGGRDRLEHRLERHHAAAAGIIASVPMSPLDVAACPAEKPMMMLRGGHRLRARPAPGQPAEMSRGARCSAVCSGPGLGHCFIAHL